MKILILGGTGYIGSELFFCLKNNKEIEVVDTVDLEWFGNYTNTNNIREDFSKLPRFFYKGYDIIILLAGHSSVQMCEKNPIGSFNNNVRNFVNLLPLLEGKKLIYASSSSVYGNIDLKEATEDCLSYNPNNYYDLTKSEIDNYAKLSGVEYYGLRFGTVNGPSPNLRTDIMINAMFETAKTQGKLKISNPGIYRPILSIMDLCKAIVKIIETKDNKYGTYNLASFNSTVDRIAGEVSNALNVPIEYIDSPAFTIEKGKLQSRAYDFSIDCSKFKNNFSFEFQGSIANIVDSLKESWGKCIHTKRNNQIHYL